MTFFAALLFPVRLFRVVAILPVVLRKVKY